MKYIRIITLAIVASIPCYYPLSAKLAPLIKFAQAITTARHSTNINKAREELLEALKIHRTTDEHTLSSIFTAFHHQNTTPLFEYHADTMYEAIKRFNMTPGFFQKIHILLHCANYKAFVKGHMYELETALALDEKGETVTQFGYPFLCTTTHKERTIDLATDRRLIECKNIDWSLYRNGNYATKLREQLLSYLAFSKKPDTDKSRIFLLSSKQPISDKWRSWLDEHEITYTDD